MKVLKIINTVSFLIMVLINILANTIPIGGKTTGEVSDAYPNLYTPTGATFSIWGIIYLFLALFILFNLGVFGASGNSDEIIHKLGPFFAISCVLNIAWIILWHSDAIGLSTIVIILLLACLIYITLELKNLGQNIIKSLFCDIGFNLYYGWIIAATIANISVWLTAIKWNRFGLSEEFWTVLVLIIGAVIAALIVLIGKTPIAAASILWAYIGIMIKHLSINGHAGKYPFVILALILTISAIIVLMIIYMIKSRKPV